MGEDEYARRGAGRAAERGGLVPRVGALEDVDERVAYGLAARSDSEGAPQPVRGLTVVAVRAAHRREVLECVGVRAIRGDGAREMTAGGGWVAGHRGDHAEVVQDAAQAIRMGRPSLGERIERPPGPGGVAGPEQSLGRLEQAVARLRLSRGTRLSIAG